MSATSSRLTKTPANDVETGGDNAYVTFSVGHQLFGLPIRDVHEVFSAHHITPVPLSPLAVKGLLNLRGRVVTAVCLRTMLGATCEGAPREPMAIGVENQGEAFALLVDRIGDVMRLPSAMLEPCPIHMSDDWQALSMGVHRLDGTILVVLDLGRLIDNESLAA